jgi:hypothetical protein
MHEYNRILLIPILKFVEKVIERITSGISAVLCYSRTEIAYAISVILKGYLC